MTPVTIKREDLARTRNIRGLSDLLTPATNYPDPWLGGEWHPRDIANIEIIASRSLLEMAAKFRPRYLRNFYDLGRENLTPKAGEPQAFIITSGQPNAEAVARLLEVLMWQGVEVYEMRKELHVKMAPEQADFHEVPLRSFVIFVNQPQKNNVLTLFERQVYPHRLLPNGDAEAPYDVAGWTLPLQMGVDYDAVYAIRDLEKERSTLVRMSSINEARDALDLAPNASPFAKIKNPLSTNSRIGLYKGYTAAMDEGWTRYVFDTFQIPYASLMDMQMRSGDLPFDVIVLPSMSENSIVKGVTAEDYPDEYKGGIGEAGIQNLKEYVENGGKLICWDDSCDAVIKWFNLPIKNVLAGLKRSEFYNPGSIVQLNVNAADPLARGLAPETAAYFVNSAAYEVLSSAGAGQRPPEGGTQNAAVRTIARYASKDALLSGWMLGEKYLNGKTALAVADHGKGKIVLFGFRPQHRAQTWGTFRFIFNALEK